MEHLAKGESVIYMSNHQSTTDWVVADMLAMRAGCVGNMRYILKDGLKYMPLYGSYFGFVSQNEVCVVSCFKLLVN